VARYPELPEGYARSAILEGRGFRRVRAKRSARSPSGSPKESRSLRPGAPGIARRGPPVRAPESERAKPRSRPAEPGPTEPPSGSRADHFQALKFRPLVPRDRRAKPVSDPEGASVWDAMYRSEEYLRRWDYRHPSAELVALVAAGTIPRGGRTLDLGCGAGRDAIFLARCGFRAVGVDLSEEALAIARGRAREAGVTVDWRRSSVLELPLPDRSVDFATDRGLIHHISEAKRPRYAAEVARVLRPGGCLLLRGSARAAAEDPDDAAFVALSEESIDRTFVPHGFRRGPVLPIALISDAGELESNLVLLRRTGRSFRRRASESRRVPRGRRGSELPSSPSRLAPNRGDP
jgi:SAM-dependent methyltransferase